MALDLASRLTKRVTFQEENAVPDEAGGYDITWDDVATVWACIEPLKGQKTDERGETYKQELYRFARITIRHRGDIRADMRMSYGGRVFAIIGLIDPDETQERLELLVREGGAV